MCFHSPKITVIPPEIPEIPPAPQPISASRVVLDQLAPDLAPELQRKESSARSRKKGIRRLQILLNLPGALSGSGLKTSGPSTTNTTTSAGSFGGLE